MKSMHLWKQPGVCLAVLAAVILGLWPLAKTVDAATTDAPPKGLSSYSIPLEEAANALAEDRVDEAGEKFKKIAVDDSLPAFIRSSALFGLVEGALAANNLDGAIKTLEQLAENEQLPQYHRDSARRRIAELQRRQKGLPGRNPAIYQASLPALHPPGLAFHVSPDGSQAGDGSALKSFATLAQAQLAIRNFKRANAGKLPTGGARVIIHGGFYSVANTLILQAEDSGSPEAPVVYQADEGETPVFSGGLRVTGWKPIAEAQLRDKLDASVRQRVLEADLAALGLTNYGDATGLRVRPELFCDGVPQTLARWPNQGFVKTGESLGTEKIKDGGAEGFRDGKFRYLEDRPSRWIEETDARLYGYWFWDWYEEYQKVAAINPETRVITLAPPYSNYGYRQGQRYCALNLFSEIDQPGEWYLDRRSGKVYWLPPEGVSANHAVVTLSVFPQPFITMRGVEHVILLGLTFQEGRGDAIHIEGGANCLVAGCTMRQFGGDGVVVEGGSRHGIFGCAIHTMGCGGTRVKGGNRATLTASHHFVENCVIADISRLKRTYTPAVLLDGCGNRVAHNLFELMPSSALRVEGNDHVIELNQIRHVVRESDDQGGIDMFGNPLYRGVVIRWNHWSDIGGGTTCGAAGVRLDDMISGVVVHGNIFERCGAVIFGGVQIHGGKENLVDGNLFLDCFAGISYSRWGEKRWMAAIKRFLPQAGSPPYSQRYPELVGLERNWDVNHISRNVFSHCASIFLRDGGMERSILNLATSQRIAPTALTETAAIRKDPQLRRLLIDPIPFGEIGPYPHPWRAKSK